MAFGGLMKIHLMVFHVGGRVVLIRNSSIRERESEREKPGVRRRKRRGRGEENGGRERNVVDKEKTPRVKRVNKTK